MNRLTVTLILGAVLVSVASPAAARNHCHIDPESQRIVCHARGVIPGPPEEPGPPGDPGPGDPIRYLYTTIDPEVGECYYWSSAPGGLDSWDPADDEAIIRIISTTPPCPGSPEPDPPPATPEAIAWEIFRSFPLAAPTITLQPPDRGITGLPSYLSAPTPLDIVHDEVLPDGRDLRVRATVIAAVVDWGDGSTTIGDPADAAPYPDGSLTHVYRLKTCSEHYRATHPAGVLCHPTLAAYPISAAWRWEGSFQLGTDPWITLGTLDVAGTTAYDVDELVGVLTP